jgi:Myb-like DNA-binding domain
MERGVGESAVSLVAAKSPHERRPAAGQASAYARQRTQEEATSTSKLLASLQGALAANRGFQSTVYAELARIHQRKAENRATAIALRRQLHQQRKSNSQSTNLPADPAESCLDSPTTTPFFSDSNGEDVPEPNPDALKRSQLEESTLLASRNPPWSSQESKALQQIIAYHQHQNNKDQPINYEHVAMQLAPSMSTSAGKPPNNPKQQRQRKGVQSSMALVPAPRPRTARECELHHRYSLQGRHTSWSKAESRKLAELAYGQESSWSNVVTSFNEHFDTRKRTPWECLVHYQTKLNVPKLHWTLPQDQLLLRYVAALGPQGVWNAPTCDAVTHLSTAYLPDKTRQQIIQRTHLSLCNPKLSSDPWTADEERKLVVCLKIYHDMFSAAGSNVDGGPHASSAAAVSKALSVIAENHFAHRSNKAVCDKWKKSLDPGHSSLPFTDEEDARLVEIASSFPQLGWADLCRQHFPTRHPERVAKRWVEVATNQQILDRERVVPASGGAASAAAVRLPKKGRRRQRGQAATSGGAEADDTHEPDDMFTTEDFCLRIKRSKQS